ncbi:MAG: NADH-quinone oxidoreductase subunit NuoK [Pirellulales bacterium]|nr:NADH-quinone oxidoreductase subunit NuoK [Pirellulales bacterium]
MIEHELNLLTNFLVVGALLFGIGLIGFLTRRNMIIMFLSAEMMLQGVSVSLVAWGRYFNDLDGQILVIFIIAVAACEAALALALILMLFQRRGNLDIALWHDLRESNLPPYVDHELPEIPPYQSGPWPTLTPAGRRPDLPQQETDYRSHV